jgi:hypothetical protein
LAEGQFLSVRFFGLFRAAIAELTAERIERKYLNHQRLAKVVVLRSGLSFGSANEVEVLVKVRQRFSIKEGGQDNGLGT